MVAGHLEEKYGIYYIVLSYKDSKGKRKVKWEATGLPVKRNKKKAEALLLERRSTFIPPVDISDVPLDSQILFADFMLKWLEIAKSSIQITTYASYQGIIQSVIDPYFRQKGIRLIDLKGVLHQTTRTCLCQLRACFKTRKLCAKCQYGKLII